MKKKLSQETLREKLADFRFENKADFATAELIDGLNDLITESIYRHRNLPVPTTFLFDAKHQVRAIYKGPVTVTRLRADLKMLDQSDEKHRDASVPFSGKWSGDLFQTHPVAVAAQYQEGGYLDDARAYLLEYLPQIETRDEKGRLQKADVCNRLGRLERLAGRSGEAVKHLREAVRWAPSSVRSSILLALTLADLGKTEEALQVVAGLKAKHPGHPDYVNLEGDILKLAGRDAEAAMRYRLVLKRNARYVPAIAALAEILAMTKDEDLRNAKEAKQLATFLMGAPGARGNPEFVLLLAEAHGASAEWKKAAVWAKRALLLTQPYGDDGKITEVKKRLVFFENQSP